MSKETSNGKYQDFAGLLKNGFNSLYWLVRHVEQYASLRSRNNQEAARKTTPPDFFDLYMSEYLSSHE